MYRYKSENRFLKIHFTGGVKEQEQIYCKLAKPHFPRRTHIIDSHCHYTNKIIGVPVKKM